MFNVQHKLLSFFGFNSEYSSNALFKGVSGSFLLNVLSIILTLISTLILARLLGAKNYGAYTYALTLIGVLGLLANFGMPNLLVREISIYILKGRWGSIKGLVARSKNIVLIVSLSLVFVASFVIIVLQEYFDNFLVKIILLSLILLPIVALNSIRAAILRGFNRVVLGQLPDLIFRPFIFLTFTLLLYHIFNKDKVTVDVIMIAQIIATVLAYFAGVIILNRCLPSQIKEAEIDFDSYTVIIRKSLPFIFLGGIEMVNSQIDIIMLGLFRSLSEVGVYRVVTTGAGLVVFSLMAANMVLGPLISSIYKSGDLARLQRIVTLSSRLVIIYSLTVAVVLMVFNEDVLLLLFGEEYVSGGVALSVLCFGQLINAAMGSVGLILIMTGYERDALKGVVITTLLNIVLNLVLIPNWGLVGAASATTLSLISWNVLLVIWVHKKIGINATVFCRFKKEKK